jgi:hypothetical protein
LQSEDAAVNSPTIYIDYATTITANLKTSSNGQASTANMGFQHSAAVVTSCQVTIDYDIWVTIYIKYGQAIVGQADLPVDGNVRRAAYLEYTDRIIAIAHPPLGVACYGGSITYIEYARSTINAAKQAVESDIRTAGYIYRTSA